MKIKKLIAGLLVLCMIISLAACGGDDATKDSTKTKDDSTKLVEVGDQAVTQNMLDAYVALYLYSNGQDPGAADEATLEMIKATFIEELVDLVVLKVYYADVKEEIITDEVQKTLDDALANAKEQEGDFLKENNVSDDLLELFITSNYYYNYLAQEIFAGYDDLDAELEAYYYAYQEDFQTVAASHILVKTEEEAKEVKSKLDDGADFSELAAEYSIDDSNAQNGGSLGTFGKDTMVEPFSSVAFALEPGQISDPVETEFGWHIIYVEKKDNFGDYEKSDDLDQQIKQKIFAAQYPEYIKGIRDKVVVTYLDDSVMNDIRQMQEEEEAQSGAEENQSEADEGQSSTDEGQNGTDGN